MHANTQTRLKRWQPLLVAAVSLFVLAAALALGLYWQPGPPTGADGGVARTDERNARGPTHAANWANVPSANDPAEVPPGNNEPEPPPPDDPAPADSEHFVLRDGGPLPEMMEWELTKTDYEAILADPNASAEAKKEAGLRHRLKFYEWPGRNKSILAGFEFKQQDYPELRDFEAADGRIYVKFYRDPEGPPLVYMRQRFVLTRPGLEIQVNISVFSSRAWAQRDFLGSILDAFGGGRISEARVGDVWSHNPHTNASSTAFVRHNISVRLDATLLEDGFELLDTASLAERIDRKIRADAVPGRTWEDIAAHRPKIERFRLNGTELVAAEGLNAVQVEFTAVPPEGQTLKAAIECENPVKGSHIRLDANTWVWAETKDPYAVTKEQSGRVWAIAYLPNLLFTVAETSIVVKPKPPAND